MSRREHALLEEIEAVREPSPPKKEEPTEPAFEGLPESECGDHRTTGTRAWCFDDTEWCYPSALCRGCELTYQRSRVRKLEKVIRAVLSEVETSSDFLPRATMTLWMRKALEERS